MASEVLNRFYNHTIFPKKCVGYQRHHLIPAQVFQNDSFVNLFAHAKEGGFDPRNFQSNGIYLPAIESLAIASGRPLHRGPHPIYNDMVCEHVNIIEKSIHGKGCTEIARRIFVMQKSMRTLLTDGSCTIKLNKRDPMSKNIDFSYLDADVDKLWAGISNVEKLMSQS